MFIVVNNGLGKHIWAAHSANPVEVMMQGLFISEVVYTFTMLCVKFSISLLYYRLFKSPQIKFVLYIVCTIVTCWAIALVMMTLQHPHLVSD